MSATKAAAPRVAVVMPGDMPALVAAMATGDERAAQRAQPVLNLVAHIRSKKGRGSTCPCCRAKVSGPFATALIYKAGSVEPSFAAVEGGPNPGHFGATGSRHRPSLIRRPKSAKRL